MTKPKAKPAGKSTAKSAGDKPHEGKTQPAVIRRGSGKARLAGGEISRDSSSGNGSL
ncbi:MAG: hypothetical protein GY761_00075 [Hyphomicrobiales bacterium]|nr:hypothetical protein [Hyphomicrobiales bacterium]